MTREKALLAFSEITKENSEISDCIFEVLSFLEGASYNSAEAHLSAGKLCSVRWDEREKKIAALNKWYAEYIADHGDDFDVWDAKQSADFSMPDEVYVKSVLLRWEG